MGLGNRSVSCEISIGENVFIKLRSVIHLG
jgi:hypothetical protein